jgi:hypothetical protein
LSQRRGTNHLLRECGGGLRIAVSGGRGGG